NQRINNALSISGGPFMNQIPAAKPPTEYVLDPDVYPHVDHIETEDDTPVDNIYSERQMRLLVDPLYSSWPGPGDGRPFLAMANVGLFFGLRMDPVVPDVMLSLDVVPDQDMTNKENLAYFIWVLGKAPDVVIEIVSNKKGGEDDTKLAIYARLGISYYIIWDPREFLKSGKLRVFCLEGRSYRPQTETWLTDVGLGLTTWTGNFEGLHQLWLRWCDKSGTLLLTGEERAEQEKQRAEQEKQRAEQEKQRAEQEKQRAEKLAEKLRQLGVDPNA
ncbi:MAG: Uma2 family endonuclease, partial [Gemmataceae bacterium]